MNAYLQLAIAILALYENLASGGAQAEANKLLTFAIQLGTAQTATTATPTTTTTTASSTTAPTTAA